METVFLRLLACDDKAAALAQAVESLRNGEPSPDVHVVDPESFRQVPGAPFAYWVSAKVLSVFSELPTFDGEGRTARVRLQTNDDFRWLRLSWEISTGSHGREKSNDLTRSWIPFAKGGTFARHYSDIHLVVDWTNEGALLKEWKLKELSLGKITANNSKCWNETLYFQSGLTWTPRTLAGLAFRIFPQGAIFAHKGPVASLNKFNLFAYLGLMNSSPYRFLIYVQMAASSFEAGIIQRTPVPDLTNPDGVRLAGLASRCVNVNRDLDRSSETSHVFHLPALLQVSGKSLAERIAAWQSRVADSQHQLAENQREIDDIAFRLYGIDGEDRRMMEVGLSVADSPGSDEEGVGEEEDES